MERLYEYNVVAQLERPAFYLRAPQQLGQAELQLGLPTRRVLIVIGRRCAGKTTFGDYLREQYDAIHLEASSLLRELGSRDGVEIVDSTSAKQFLDNHGYAVVAKEVLRILEIFSSQAVVVTGIRTIEELEELLRAVPSMEVITIEADTKTRFLRHIHCTSSEPIPTI